MTEHRKTKSDGLPVKVVSRRLACENTKFFAHFDHVIDKAGSEVRDYLVVTPKNAGKGLVSGVAILPFANGTVGLIRIYRPAIRAFSWEIPHGFVNEGESDSESAQRELLEETGLTAESRRFSSLGYILPDSGILAARVHMFLAEGCHSKQQGEHELGLWEFRFFSFLEVEKMIESSEVQDSFTLAAWCKYQLLGGFKSQVQKVQHDAA